MIYGCVCGPQKFISHTFFILALIRWALSPLEKDIKLFGGKFYSLFASESLIWSAVWYAVIKGGYNGFIGVFLSQQTPAVAINKVDKHE